MLEQSTFLSSGEIVAIGDIIAAQQADPNADLPFEVVQKRLTEYFSPEELDSLRGALEGATDPATRRGILNGALFIKEVRISVAARSEFESIISDL